MSKILKTAAIVVGAVALVATGIGAAAGAGLIGAGIGSTATVAGIAASTFTTIGTLAGVAAGVLSIGASLTAKKPTAQATGSPTDFSADPDAGIPLAIGRTGTAGDITARFGFDTKDKGDNDRQSFVATLSLGPIDAVEGQTVDKASVSYLASGAAIGAFAGFMWSMTQLGAMPEANALGFGAGAGSPPGWTAQHRMSGKAAASWTLRFDPNGKIFANGVPAPMWTLRGAKCYDPTKDSTYPGGAGSHRMADPADTAAYDAAVDTWEWSEDPYLLGLRWAHGVWQRDRSNPNSTYQRVMGMGANWSGIDVAAFVEGRNVAHANGWKVGGMIYSGDDKWDTMKKILQAGMGEPLALGARISCLVNAPKVSLANITIDDVIGAASVAATQPRRNRINTITPRYRLEENNWQLLPGAPITVPEYVIADRGKRSKVQDYPFIQQTPQVATAVRYDIENAREFGPITLPLKLVWMGYKPGDCVTVTLPEVGLNAQPVLLLNRELDPSQGVVTMTARSETAAKHPFALGQTTTPPPTPGLTGPPLIPVPAANAWAITGTSIQSVSGIVPALVIEGARDASAIDGIVFDYRKFADGLGPDDGWITAGIEPPSAVAKVITGVQSNQPYQVSVRYSRASRNGSRLILGPVGTDTALVALVPPGAAIGGTVGPDGTIIGGAPAATIIDALAELASTGDQSAFVAGVKALVDRGRVSQQALLATQLLAEERKQLTDALTHLNGIPMGTQVTRVEKQQIDGDQVLAESIEQVSAGVETLGGTVTAQVARLDQAIVDGDHAQATHLQDVQAQLQGNIGGVDSRVTSEVSRLDTAIATGDQAQATALQSVKVDLQGGIAGVDGRVTSEIARVDKAIADGDSAQASALQSTKAELLGGIAGVDGRVTSEVTRLDNSVAAGDKASADALESTKAELQGGIAGVDGRVTSEVSRLDSAIATGDQAQASALQSTKAELLGDIGGVADHVTSEVTRLDNSIATKDQAQSTALQTVQADLDGRVTSEVTRIDQAIADQGSSTATSLTQIESTLDGQSSSVQFLLEAVNGEQALAQLSVTVHDNGVAEVTGLKINGQQRSIVFAADLLVVGDSSIFQVDTQTGVVSMNDVVVGRLRANSVTTDALVDHSVTAPTWIDGWSGSVDSGASPSYSDALTITSTGGLVRIDVSFDASVVSGTGGQFYGQLLRDGGAITRQFKLNVSASNSGVPLFFFIPDSPPAGTHTYQMSFGRLASGSAELNYQNGQTFAQEFKK